MTNPCRAGMPTPAFDTTEPCPEQYAYQMHSVGGWAQCQPNSHWLLELNTFGQVVSAQPERWRA